MDLHAKLNGDRFLHNVIGEQTLLSRDTIRMHPDASPYMYRRCM